MPLNLSPTQLAFNARGDGTFNQPFEEQVAFLKQKLNLPTAHWDDILTGAHDRAFMVAGAMKADLLADIHAEVIKNAAAGQSIGAFKKAFEALVKKHGWEGWTGSDTEAGRDWRARVIYNTNMRAGYAAGRYAQLTDPELLQSRPYWKYIHNDTVAHPRPLHQSWNGTVLKYDDPFWDSHYPPNGFGCRCRIAAVRPTEYKGHPAPDDGTYEKTDRNGVVHTLPKGVDYGWDYKPGASVAKSFKSLIDDKLIRLPAPVGAAMMEALKPIMAMEMQAQWIGTLNTWLATEQVGRVAIVGAIDTPTLNWLDENKKIAPKTAEIAIREGLIKGTKQTRHEKKTSDALSEMEWQQLPEIVSNPDQILFDTRSGYVIYVLKTNNPAIKLSVKFDYAKKGVKTNMIVSAFKQSVSTIAEMIKGKVYERIK
ncbi:MAG: phage minor head protein [Methylococcaceae bacterium]